MSLADINLYFDLDTLFVTNDKLYLDPNNPRLIVDSEDDIKYSNVKAISEDVQSDILVKINRSEFKVDDLVKSIYEKGFLNGTSPLIVKEIDKSGKYLVLEGNRRIAAIKNILKEQNIGSSCLNTLKSIEVKVFKYKKNKQYSEDQIINVILGQIHVSGALGWGAMERAHYIYRSYQMELSKTNSSKEFSVNKNAIRNVSEIYSFKENEIIKNLKIYRVYEQIKYAGYQIRPDCFTLIDLSVSDSNLSKDYFGLDDEYQFSNVGVDRFIKLMVSKNGPISNPKLFKEFSFIYKNGNDKDISCVENLVSNLSEVYLDVKKHKKGSYLYDRLSQIHNDLMKIDISELGELTKQSKEFMEAEHIVKIVIKKVYPLIDKIKNSNIDKLKRAPLTVDDVGKLSSKEINGIIRETFKLMPNKTCAADFNILATKSLRYLKIITRGKKRERYNLIIREEAKNMLSAGIIKIYRTNKNERFKLIG